MRVLCVEGEFVVDAPFEPGRSHLLMLNGCQVLGMLLNHIPTVPAPQYGQGSRCNPRIRLTVDILGAEDTPPAAESIDQVAARVVAEQQSAAHGPYCGEDV